MKIRSSLTPLFGAEQFLIREYNVANSGRLVVDFFVRKWRSHAQKKRRQGCPRSAATDAGLLC